MIHQGFIPRRKVVNTNNQYPYNPQSSRKIYQKVGFDSLGSERQKLAQYVAAQLQQNHKDDASTLEKFRKQAQIFKRQKLRGKHPHLLSQKLMPINSLPKIYNQSPQKIQYPIFTQSKIQQITHQQQKYQPNINASSPNPTPQQINMPQPQIIILKDENHKVNQFERQLNSYLKKQLKLKKQEIRQMKKKMKKMKNFVKQLKEQKLDIQHRHNQNKLDDVYQLIRDIEDKVTGNGNILSKSILQMHALSNQWSKQRKVKNKSTNLSKKNNIQEVFPQNYDYLKSQAKLPSISYSLIKNNSKYSGDQSSVMEAKDIKNAAQNLKRINQRINLFI